MVQKSLFHSLFAFGLCVEGLTAVILTQQRVMVMVGGDAHLSCQLTENKEVHQVTWQKVLPSENKNVASYSEHVGQTVNPDFRGKVQFVDAQLKINSIVIRNITEQDERCYLCLFNAYPDGSVRNRTCLHLYELHEPVLHVEESNSPGELLVSCSATGRPAPTVALTVSSQHLNFSLSNTVSVRNTDGTVTISTTALLTRFHGSSTTVGCAAQVFCSPQIQTFRTIPRSKQTSDGLEEKSGSSQRGFRWPLIATFSLMVFCGCVAVIIVVLLRKKTQNRSDRSDIQQTVVA